MKENKQITYIVMIVALTEAAQNKLLAFMPEHITESTDSNCLDEVNQRIAKRASKDGSLANLFIYKFTDEASQKNYETNFQPVIGAKFGAHFKDELANLHILVFRNWDNIETVYKRAIVTQPANVNHNDTEAGEGQIHSGHS